MNLPQVGSVIVIFSLVILLGFGSMGTAEAAKASGVYASEINSAKVCGVQLCSDYTGGKAAFDQYMANYLG